MSGMNSMELQVLGKNKLRELAKQERGAAAKQVQQNATMFQPSDVVFQAPVKVRPDDPDYNKLQNKLGNYEVATQIFKTTKTRDLLGIERQPVTPQPSKVPAAEFFKLDNPRTKNLFPDPKTVGKNPHFPGPDHRSRPGTDHIPLPGANAKGPKTFPKLESTLSAIMKAVHKPANSLSHGEAHVKIGPSHHVNVKQEVSKTSSAPSPSKLVKSIESAHQSYKKETKSAKHQPTNREPVLSSLSHELDVDKSESTSHSNPKRTPIDPSTILKEGNRNGIVNGVKNRPILHMPEKNIDDMLKEMTRVSQPLTAIQTPIKTEGKFPFQVTDKVQPLVKGLAGNVAAVKGKISTIPNKKLEVPNKKLDEHENNTEDSSDSDEDGEICSADEGSDDEEMKLSDADEPKDTTVHKISPAPGSRGRHGVKAPVKKSGSPMLSSDSSSSSSDGSSSSSDSDSDNDGSGSDDDAEDRLSNIASPAAKTKSSPDDLEMSPSPSSAKKWNLSNYLKQEEHDSFIHSKPPSLEAPSSNRSDKSEVDDVVLCVQPARGADQVISDDNPPSDKVPDDHDAFPKPMSPNEFSPPGIYNKQGVIAPVKSPTNATRRAYHKPSAVEKLQKNLKPNADSLPSTNTYDVIKSRKRSTVLKSPETNSKSPKVLEQTSIPNKRGRKKQKLKSVAIISSSSESDSDFDVVNSSASSVHAETESSRKPFARSPKKSHHIPSASKSPVSTKPTFIAKKKESKSEKHLKEEDSVKLKADIKKSSNICDIRIVVSDIHKDTSVFNKKCSTSAIKQEPDSIEKILNTVTPLEPLLSPIPNEPVRTKPPVRTKDLLRSPHQKSETIHMPDKTKSVPKKADSLNVSVSISNGKPSVMVHLDLDLLGKLLYFDKSKLKGDSSMVENVSNKQLQKGSELVSHSKSSIPESTQSTNTAKLTSTKPGYSIKSEKVDNIKDVCDKSHTLPSPHKNSTSDSCNKSSDKNGANSVNNENSPSDTRTSKSVGKSTHVQKVLNLEKSDPIPSRDFDSLPQRKPRRPLECLTDSDISESSTDCESEDEAKTRTKLLSPIRDNATTCLAISPDKKRKSDSHRAEDSKRRRTLTRSPHSKLTPQLESSSLDDDREWNNKRPAKSKDAYSDGSSSQHSSHATSQHNLHSQSRPKRPKLEPTSDHKSSSDTTHMSPSSSSRHPGKPAPETVQANGHTHPSGATPHRHPSPTARKHSGWHPRCKEEELLQRSDVYHKRAKEFKHEADGLDGGLQKRVLYIEAVLCFIQCGCAMEKDRLITDSATMFKETHRFVVHGCHCRPHHHENSAELKLSVLCMRIQSLLYLKLFHLKKVETLKLKRILEDHNNKSLKQSSGQPKPPPSAPSPHQTNWNRANGTPSPMSPTPSPAGSVGSIGSVGSANDMGTPSKTTNGSTAAAVVGSSIAVPQRIHSITQKYFTSTNYVLMCHDLWDQGDAAITDNVKDYFIQLDASCGQLSMQSSLLHLVHYVRQGLQPLKAK